MVDVIVIVLSGESMKYIDFSHNQIEKTIGLYIV